MEPFKDPATASETISLLQKKIDGFRFCPTDAELIDYLTSEEPGYRESLCIIPTLTNFNDLNPRDLLAEFKGKSIIPSNDRECWFIIPQKQGKRVPRKTPSGSWKVTSEETPIKIDGNSNPIGFKKILSFPDGKIGKSNYIIHEYRLPDKDSNYVLCHFMCKQDERADNSTTRSEHGATEQVGLESHLYRSDDGGSFPELRRNICSVHTLNICLDKRMECVVINILPIVSYYCCFMFTCIAWEVN
ncbi:hypothetical protein BT93_G0341 [Corymbia citriodora subsp. variegata]|nr:hypothetical protein BT93_G0341 [Corymbia citriodora subsp. variegata]